VPHFASLRGHERETTILLSEDARTWREHIFKAKEDDVVNVLQAMFDGMITKYNTITQIIKFIQ